jgi:hypothetical protein
MKSAIWKLEQKCNDYINGQIEKMEYESMGWTQLA